MLFIYVCDIYTVFLRIVLWMQHVEFMSETGSFSLIFPKLGKPFTTEDIKRFSLDRDSYHFQIIDVLSGDDAHRLRLPEGFAVFWLRFRGCSKDDYRTFHLPKSMLIDQMVKPDQDKWWKFYDNQGELQINSAH